MASSGIPDYNFGMADHPRASATIPVPVKLTPAEVEDLRGRAAGAGQTLSEWVRGRLGLPPARRGRPPKSEAVR